MRAVEKRSYVQALKSERGGESSDNDIDDPVLSCSTACNGSFQDIKPAESLTEVDDGPATVTLSDNDMESDAELPVFSLSTTRPLKRAQKAGVQWSSVAKAAPASGAQEEKMDLLRSMAASMADKISDLRKDLRTATTQVHQIISADYESRITSVEAKLREYISPLLSRRRTVQNLLAVLTCPVCHDMPTFSNIMISCCCGSMCCLPCLMTWSPSSNDVDNENDDERLRCPCCRATSPKQSFHCLPRWAGL